VEKQNKGRGTAGFDKNEFMYEVADEIRTGVNEDKNKNKNWENQKSFGTKESTTKTFTGESTEGCDKTETKETHNKK